MAKNNLTPPSKKGGVKRQNHGGYWIISLSKQVIHQDLTLHYARMDTMYYAEGCHQRRGKAFGGLRLGFEQSHPVP